MFSVGEFIVHKNNGICKVSKIAPLPADMGGTDQAYYFLAPLNSKGEIFTPAEENNVNIRGVLTKKEALKLIDEIPNLEDEVIENDKLRDAHYKDALKSNDCRAYVKILKTLYARRVQRMAVGKKSTASEERYYKQAEESLYSELAFAIGKEREAIKAIVAEKAQIVE